MTRAGSPADAGGVVPGGPHRLARGRNRRRHPTPEFQARGNRRIGGFTRLATALRVARAQANKCDAP
jgi:hypothetical protein